MTLIFVVIAIAVIASICSFLFKILKGPMNFIFKVLLHVLFGFLMLFIVNFLGAFIGFSLEMNIITALVAGILGMPGVIILIVLALMF